MTYAGRKTREPDTLALKPKAVRSSAPGGLRIGNPNDAYEQEADRVADAVMSGRRTPSWSISKMTLGTVQRQSPGDQPAPKPNNYDEAAKKLGEAFLKTDVGKKLTDAAKQDALVKSAEGFVDTLPGKIIAGAVAVGAVSALAATHTALPVQLPEIPLDRIRPGLSVKMTYEGPVDHPAKAAMTFSYSPKGEEKKPKQTASERYRADTARLAAEQETFRAEMTYKPGSAEDIQQKQEQKAVEDYALHRFGALPGTGGQRLIPAYSGLKGSPGAGLRLPTFESPFKPKPIHVLDQQLELKPLTSSNAPSEPEKREEPPPVQRKAEGGATAADGTAAPAIVHEVLNSLGQPLDYGSRTKFERGLGRDLSQIRIHADANAAESARAVNSLAYTVGKHVVFGRDQYKPGSRQGDHLLAHELAHTVQQEHSSQIYLQRKEGPEQRQQASEAPINVREWITTLPRAVRTKDTQIKKVPNKLELEHTTLGGVELNDQQKAIVKQIALNRAQLLVYPWLQVVPAQFRKKKGEEQTDTKGGFYYPGEAFKSGAGQSKARKEVAAELGTKEGKLSAVNTYDDAILTLGPGLTGALLSRGMERFFSKDEEAKNKFLDAGVAFSAGKLLMVNTDNGAVEEDPMVGGDKGPKNARMLFSLSVPLLSLFVHLAESDEHGPLLHAALQQSTPALQIPASVEGWTDMMAVRLAAHLVHWRSSSWSLYAGTGGNVKSIMRAFATQVPPNPDLGGAHVLSESQASVLFAFAGGKAKEAFAGTVDIPNKPDKDSLTNKLLVGASGTTYYQLSL